MNGQNSINDRGSMAIISTKEEIVDIYLKYQKSLFHLAMTYVDTLYLAEDLVEDTIVAILEKPPVFESEASCVCYLRQIVRNKAKSMLRKKYKIEPQEDTDIEEQLIKSIAEKQLDFAGRDFYSHRVKRIPFFHYPHDLSEGH